MNLKRIGIAAVFAVMSLSLAACGQPIKAFEAAVEVKEIGDQAGVQETEITTGRYFNHPFSYRYIVKFPTTMQTYTWNGAKVNGERVNPPCFRFINEDKVLVTACLTANIRIDPSKADDIVRKYRGSITGKGGEDGYVLDDVVYGPVAREIQNTLNFTGVEYSTQELYTDGGRDLAKRVTAVVTRKFEKEGIIFDGDLLWASPPALPEDIVQSITGALRAQTDARKKDAELAATIAEGKKREAQAVYDAKANDALGDSIRRNPELLALKEVEKSKGLCPRNATVCVIGASPTLIDSYARNR
jgi:hypothetical protein